MIELIILSIFILLSFTLAGLSLFYWKKYRKMIKIIAQQIIDREIIVEKMDSMEMQLSKENNNGFIKFLSESRQSAYDYIEQVQESIKNYIVALENNNDDEILTARMELFSHLPEGSDDVEND